MSPSHARGAALRLRTTRFAPGRAGPRPVTPYSHGFLRNDQQGCAFSTGRFGSGPWSRTRVRRARSGLLETPHGCVATPAFMPVGTQATVKGLTPEQIQGTGTQMLLANTYHLALRPGEDEVAALGGLHSFMGWDGPILTDSGGFQVFSLSDRNRVTDQGVTFRSHLDGSILELTPERAIAIQEKLGADVAMCLDQCPRAARHERGDRGGRESDNRLGLALQGGAPACRSSPVRNRSGGPSCRSPRVLRRGDCGPRLRRLCDRRRQRGRGARASCVRRSR